MDHDLHRWIKETTDEILDSVKKFKVEEIYWFLDTTLRGNTVIKYLKVMEEFQFLALGNYNDPEARDLSYEDIGENLFQYQKNLIRILSYKVQKGMEHYYYRHDRSSSSSSSSSSSEETLEMTTESEEMTSDEEDMPIMFSVIGFNGRMA